MKLSIFTTITDPYLRGDNYDSAIGCYKQLADEVTVVDGGRQNQNEVGLNYLYKAWPKEFDWRLIGEQFQRGYEVCTGDWVLHMDLDFIFHERDFNNIRQTLERHADTPALSFWKYQFVLPDRYNIKSRLVIAVNKGRFGDRIKFDGGGEQDLCQPSLDGKYLSPDDVPEANIPFYNYEHMLKTKEQITEDVGRMDRAYHRCFGKYQYGDGTDEKAFEGWYRMVSGRFGKPQKSIPLADHPKYVQDTIRNLKPEQFGYNGFGLIDGRVYA